MKSLYLLCEYGISHHTVQLLENNGISFADIVYNPSVLFTFWNENSKKARDILNIISKANENERDTSIYDLIRYGISVGTVNRLFRQKLELKDLYGLTPNELQVKVHLNIPSSYEVARVLERISNNEKSLYLLCEYGISHHTVQLLESKGIAFSHILDDPSILHTLWNENSKKAQDILSVIRSADENNRIMSVYDLIKYGLSSINADKLHKQGLELKDLYGLTPRELEEKTHLNMRNSDELQKMLYKIQILDTMVEVEEKRQPEFIYGIIKGQKLKDFTIEDLKKALTQNNIKYNYDFLEEDLKELLAEKKIEMENDLYNKFVPSLLEVIDYIADERGKYVVLEKLKGRTLESIGSEFNITRERVRQIFAKHFRKMKYHKVKEDSYREVYETYNFTEDVFCKFYKVDKIVFSYLRERYEGGTKNIDNLLSGIELTSEQEEIIRKKNKLVVYGGEYIPANRSSLLEAIIKEEEGYFVAKDIAEKYNRIVEELSCSLLEPIGGDVARNIEGLLYRSSLVLATTNNRFRYYNFDSLSKEDIKGLVKLLKLESGSYTTELLYRNNRDLMERLDIRDGYELHNVLRRLNSDSIVKFTRMPDFLVSCDDKNKFIEMLINEYSPIKIDRFVDIVYEKYGHRKDTFKAYLSAQFNKYLNGDDIVEPNKYKKMVEEDVDFIMSLM